MSKWFSLRLLCHFESYESKKSLVWDIVQPVSAEKQMKISPEEMKKGN